MKLGKMEKFSPFYLIVKYSIVKHFHNLFWYKKVTVTGLKNLEKGKSYIITPNHQNALMDALIFVVNNPFQIVWLARADIFNSKFTRPILRFLRIMPIYRIRDGASSLGKNEAIFNKSIEVLEHKIPLALFPETTHWGFRKLRATKKAVPRIAFMAEERNNYNLDIHIVPCGIFYEEYQPARSRALLQYGKPFPIKEYIDIYKENENKGYHALRKRIENEIRPLILDIKSETYYDTYDTIRNVFDEFIPAKSTISKNSILHKFNAQKEIVAALDLELSKNENSIDELKQLAEEYNKLKTQLRFKENVFSIKMERTFFILWSILKLIVFFPLFLYGAILHFIPYNIPRLLTKKIVKDPQFVSSFNFTLIQVLILLFHAIYLAIFITKMSSSPLWIAVFFISLLFSSVYAIDYYNSLILLINTIRFSILKIKRNNNLEKLLELRKLIIAKTELIFKSYLESKE